MNTEQQPGPATPPPPEEAGWGAPPPPPEQRRRWSPRQIAVTVAVAVVIAAGGGVAIWAAGGATTDDDGGQRADGGPQMVVGGPMSELGHGEFQNGEVTAISDTSLTVRSEDGYERTYTIDDDTQLAGDIDKGDDVSITATVEGDTATAAMVVEPGEMNRRPGGGGGPPPMGRN